MAQPLKTDPLDLPETPTGDLDFNAMARGVWASGPKGVAQLIDQKIRLVTEEWCLNLDTGIDYFGQLFGRRFDQRRTQDIYRAAIITVPGVDKVTVLATFQRPVLTVNWEATCSFGDTVSGSFSTEIS